MPLHVRGISTAIVGKRLAPTTLPNMNGEYLLLDQLRNDIRVAIDVGANVGEWSERAIRECPSLERLVCFEPVRWAAEDLARRLASDKRVVLVRRALSDQPGALTMWEEPVGGTMSSAVPGYSTLATPAIAMAATLDEELERLSIEHVDFLKIDVEGLDLHVLRGAARSLQAQRIGAVQFEYGDAWQRAGSTLRAAFALLSGAGYHNLLVTPYGLREFSLENTTELYTYANFVGLSPDLAARFEPADPIW